MGDWPSAKDTAESPRSLATELRGADGTEQSSNVTLAMTRYLILKAFEPDAVAYICNCKPSGS